MQTAGPVLAFSDLTLRSDAAVEFAGFLASASAAELHVVHSLGLMRKPLRAVAPALNDFGITLRDLDRKLRAQLDRVVQHDVMLSPPTIDFDDAMTALRRCAMQLRPLAIVTPDLPVWIVEGAADLRTLLSNGYSTLFIVRKPISSIERTAILRLEQGAGEDVLADFVETSPADLIAVEAEAGVHTANEMMSSTLTGRICV